MGGGAQGGGIVDLFDIFNPAPTEIALGLLVVAFLVVVWGTLRGA